MGIENVMDAMLKEAKQASFIRGMKVGGAIASLACVGMNFFCIWYERKLEEEEAKVEVE